MYRKLEKLHYKVNKTKLDLENKTTLNEDCDNGTQIVKEKIDVYLYY